MKLFVKDVSGSWTEREFVLDGSYMVFAFTAEDTGFALMEDTGAMVEKMAVVAIGLLVLIIAFILIGKRRKKVKQKKNKQ